jgi:RNA recognition motif-containing protein
MSTNIYVGNLAFSTDSAALRALFAKYGEVTSAQVVSDRDTGRSRGFGFVEMASAEEAQKAIAETNGTNVDGRQLNVNIARERSRA